MRYTNVKEFIRAITPPALLAVLVELRDRRPLRFWGKFFVGVFTTFDEVARNFHGTVPYNSRESEQEEAAGTVRSRKRALEARRGVAPGGVPGHHALFCAFAATMPEPEFTILDVGGGTGETLAQLTYSCPRLRPHLVVYDLPPVVRAGREAFRGDPAISFADSLTDVKRPVHIVFLGASLMYFEDYGLLLDQIIAFRPRIIMFGHTPMTDAPTFVTAQVNMKGRVIPNKIVNRAELTSRLNSLGFNLIHRSESYAPAHFRNFPSPQNRSSFSNMVFAAKR